MRKYLGVIDNQLETETGYEFLGIDSGQRRVCRLQQRRARQVQQRQNHQLGHVLLLSIAS